ncbi:MAG: OmpH family outer membrane protein [Steroidobacteraceae bacterium]
MKRLSRSHSFLWMIAAGLLVSALAAASAQAAALKIGVVNYGVLVQSSPQYKAAIASLRAEFLPKQKQLQAEAKALQAKQQKLQRNEATMTQDQVAQAELDLREKVESFRQESGKVQDALNTRRTELFTKVQNAIALVVQRYAKQHGYNLVMMNDGVIYADSGLDLTPAILQILKAAPAGK